MPKPPPGLPGFHILAKPIGPSCNLECDYCFYLHKERFFAAGEDRRMSLETLELFTRQYLEGQKAPEVCFAWQGGEPTLLGVDFFRRAVEFQKKHARHGQAVTNAFQTNGLLLDDEWAAFFKEHDFLIGLSIDGPQRLHDKHRRNRVGGGSHRQVMQALEHLHRRGVRVNSLTVVNRDNAPHGAEVYRFLRDECRLEHLQFIPCVEAVEFEEAAPGRAWSEGAPKSRVDARLRVTPWSVLPEQFGRFLCEVFDEWVMKDVGRVFVQHFEQTLGGVLGLPASLCIFSPVCGRSLIIEHDGSLYACDHFVYPEHRRGDIREKPLVEWVESEAQRRFGEEKFTRLPRRCKRCEFLGLCYGECPKNRLLTAPDGEPGLNYLCAGLQLYFRHTVPVFQLMAKGLSEGHTAPETMEFLRRRKDAAPRPERR